MQEIWKDIPGYAGYYQVSNSGRIRSVNRVILSSGFKQNRKGKILNQTKQTTGYSTVNLCVENIRKRFLVHRLVAEAFIPNPDNMPHINHKDENKENNSVENLEWCDPKYNNNYGTFNERVSKSKKKPVICVELKIRFDSQGEASRITGISQACISCSCYNPNRKAGGYHWKFAEG